MSTFGECPVSRFDYDRILLGHGSGGRLTNELIGKLFLPAFGERKLTVMEDSATLSFEEAGSRIAFTTDGFVVQPIFFPGGDIGRLAVCGTVNDLAVAGAVPKYLSAAFILEEGLPLDELRRIAESMRAACDEAGIELVTGDTKVVDRGKGDQVFITTTGLGVVPQGRDLSVRNAKPGDRILVSGTIGDHGVAILSVREGIEFETVLKSDVAPLNGLAETMLNACPSIRWMRDPTRGGIAGVLNDLASASNVEIRVTESTMPVRPEVKAACEMLGLDSIYVANEGKLVAVVPEADADRLLEATRQHPLGRDAALIGTVVAGRSGLVVMQSLVGGDRVLPVLAGEQLPRIC